MFGKEWPLTVDKVVVSCPVSGAVVATAGGVDYAVNGAAKTFAQTYGWNDGIEPIWAPDPDVEGLRIDIGPIIDFGLELCETAQVDHAYERPRAQVPTIGI